jgi:hypothetical protein
MTLVAALVCLVVWILFTFVFPLGPAGAPLHLLLGLTGVLLVRWWALTGNGKQ